MESLDEPTVRLYPGGIRQYILEVNDNTPIVAVIGAGFGGLKAVKRLVQAPVSVILFDRNNYHLFQPLLYQVASAYLDPRQIAAPVRGIFRGRSNLSFVMDEVTEVDVHNRRVVTETGSYRYDYLVFSAGSETNFFGIDGAAENALPLKSMDDGIRIRNRILSRLEAATLEKNDEARRALLTFVVGGGGPTGVEMAGALAELVRRILIKDFPGLETGEFRIVLCEATSKILPDMPDDLSVKARKLLESRGVEVVTDAFIEGYDGSGVVFRDGSRLPAKTLVWTAGMNAAGLTSSLGVELARDGRVPVDEFLRVRGYPEVYVIGDAAWVTGAGGKPLPMVAPAAVQMADSAAANIRRSLSGLEPIPFVYDDLGSLATIGRNAAVANVKGVKLAGFPAWIVWLGVHLIRLIGFRNRLIVLLDWTLDYFFSERASRLII